MTPDPPSPSEGTPLPPRHRPTIKSLGTDTTERDFWSFDDDDDSPAPAAEAETAITENPASGLAGEPGVEPEKPVAPPAAKKKKAAAKRASAKPRKKTTPPENPEPVMEEPAAEEEPVTRLSPEIASEPAPAPEEAVKEEKEDKTDSPVRTRPKPRGLASSSGGKSGVSLSVSPNKPIQSSPSSALSDLEDLGDLDDWDEPSPTPSVKTPEKPIEEPEPETVREYSKSTQDAGLQIPTPEPETDEFAIKSSGETGASGLMALRPKLGLSKIEKIGLISLAVMLLVACGLAINYTLGRLPTSSGSLVKVDFPVKGSRITIAAAETFWREPLDSEGVRRGTVMIPVIELEPSAGTGALRIFFRDQNAGIVGDPVSLAVNGTKKLNAAASAGFDGTGDYAAYRTPEGEPWNVEVFEGPSTNAAFSEFTLLFEAPISTNRR